MGVLWLSLLDFFSCLTSLTFVLFSNDYLNADQNPDPNTIIFDSPDDSMWNDKQDVRKLKHKPTVSVTIDLQKKKWNKMLS